MTKPKPIKRTRIASATLHAQMIAALQRGIGIRAELAAELGSKQEVVKRFLDELRDLGVVYIKERIKLGKTSWTEVFAMNESPFENEDAPRKTR